MSKTFGTMTSDEVLKHYDELQHQIDENDAEGSKLMMIPKCVFVALVSEIKDLANRRFFFELGRTIRLSENQEATLKNVPEKYKREFLDGVGVARTLENADDRCLRCYKAKTINTARGKVYVAKLLEQKNNENSSV